MAKFTGPLIGFIFVLINTRGNQLYKYFSRQEAKAKQFTAG